MRRYIDLPRVGILADAFHMNIEEDDMAGALAAYGRHIVSVDIADNQRRRPGSGQLDFRAFLAGLARSAPRLAQHGVRSRQRALPEGGSQTYRGDRSGPGA